MTTLTHHNEINILSKVVLILLHPTTASKKNNGKAGKRYRNGSGAYVRKDSAAKMKITPNENEINIFRKFLLLFNIAIIA